MNTAVERRIREMAGPTMPTEDQVQGLLNGWREFFASIGLKEAQQMAEFEAIMKARVRNGIVSVVAPQRLTE